MTWDFLAALLLRTGSILIAAEALRRLCFRSGPAARFRLRVMAICLLAAWPLLAFFLPAISVPVAPATPVRGLVTVSETFRLIAPGYRAFSPSWLLIGWLLGAGIALVPLIAGWLYVRKLLNQADPIREQGWKQLLGELCRSAGIENPPGLYSAQRVSAPVTAGLRHPQILLPSSCMDWPESRRRAVLLHELAHVRRRDLLVQVFVQIVAALWWFQPLVWIARRGIRQESELACDAEAVAAGMRASQYAEELLAVARDATGRGGRLAVAISMAPPRGIEARLAAILNPPLVLRSTRRGALAVAVLVAVAIAASATSFRSNEVSGERGLSMKRTLISGLLASVGLSAATVSGSLFDITGSAIPDAKILLYSPDSGMKQEAVTGADGKFSIENAPAGSAILRVEKPGFSSVFREFDLKSDSNVDRGLTMQVGPMQQEVTVDGQSAAPQEVTPLGTDRLRIRGSVEQSHLISKKTPIYPVPAKKAGIQGIVSLEAVISKEGVPQEIRVLSSPSDDLSESALEAVRDWRYSPTLLNGSPVEVLTEIIVHYTLAP